MRYMFAGICIYTFEYYWNGERKTIQNLDKLKHLPPFFARFSCSFPVCLLAFPATTGSSLSSLRFIECGISTETRNGSS